MKINRYGHSPLQFAKKLFQYEKINMAELVIANQLLDSEGKAIDVEDMDSRLEMLEGTVMGLEEENDELKVRLQAVEKLVRLLFSRTIN